MKLKFLQLLVLIFISTNTFSQTKFLKAYFINNSGQKIECYIKNVDWRNNPTQFEYKLNENEKSIINKIDDVKEFSIYENVKFIRETVDIDKSPDNIQNYSIQREPIFINKQVFLKVLVEGTNNLYLYEAEFGTKLFFSNKTNKIIQLIYKKYFESSNNKTDLFENNDFKKQLLINLKYINNNSINNDYLEYNKTEMTKYFLKVNECQGDKNNKQVSVNNKAKINLKPIISINSSSVNLDFKTGNTQGNYDLEKKTSIGYGFEFEIILPFYNYGWSVFAQPTYNLYESNKSIYIPFDTFPNYNINLKYNYLQIPLGVRKLFFVNESSKISIDIAYNIRISGSSSKLEIDRQNTIDLSGLRNNIVFGLGFRFKKFDLGLNYFLNQELSDLNSKNSIKFSNTSINLKYILF